MLALFRKNCNLRKKIISDYAPTMNSVTTHSVYSGINSELLPGRAI